MSGGVDSSVAAHLLLEQGHDVIGVFMRHGERSPAVCGADEISDGANGLQLPVVNRLDHKQGCCTAADAADARRVADKLGIPFYALNLDQEFGPDYRLLCRRILGRPHTQSLRAVQQLD